MIDECITRIVFSKSAIDPDFDTYSIDSESIGDSGFAFGEHMPSARHGSIHDLTHMSANGASHLIATENEIQINLMKGRVEHLEHVRDKLTQTLQAIISKVSRKGTVADALLIPRLG